MWERDPEGMLMRERGDRGGERVEKTESVSMGSYVSGCTVSGEARSLVLPLTGR